MEGGPSVHYSTLYRGRPINLQGSPHSKRRKVAYLLHLVVGRPGIPGPLFVFRPTARYAKAVRLDGLGLVLSCLGPSYLNKLLVLSTLKHGFALLCFALL